MTRFLPLVLGLALLSGCGAVSAVSDASTPLDAYTLAPVTPTATRSTGLHLVVPPAAAAGALATDRILIKPNRLQAAYLPEGRWSDPAPVLVQSLLVTSLQNGGGYRLVARDDGGLLADYTLLSDLRDFQVETLAGQTPGFQVRVGLLLTLVRESDRRIAASRRFDATVPAASDDTLVLVTAFDTALSQVLREAVGWTQSQAR